MLVGCQNLRDEITISMRMAANFLIEWNRLGQW